MASKTAITLFSSESTTKYIKDVFSVLALPRDAEYQFRYETKYVESSVRSSIFSGGNCSGTLALIAFRSSNTESHEKRFIIPIRWVEIIEAIYVSDFYTVKFRVKCYPAFSNDFKEKCHTFSDINTFAKTILIDSTTNDLAVLNSVIPIVGDHKDDINRDNEYWRSIVSVFSLLPMYENHYFLRCSPFLFANDKPCTFENNFTKLEEEKCVYLKIDYYQRKYDPLHDSKIDIILDNNIISHSSGLRTKMETRYDSIKLGFQPKNTMDGTQSEIIICTSDSTEKKQTEISLPIIIVKRKSLRIAKAIVMSIGACLVGLPAFLPDTFQITWKIIIAVIGASVMGLNNYYDSNEK